MCEKVRQQPEARKITGMEAKREYRAVRMQEKREAKQGGGDGKKSGKRDVDARDLSGRVRASISQSTFFFYSAPHLWYPSSFHLTYILRCFEDKDEQATAERKNEFYLACRQKCEIKLIPMHLSEVNVLQYSILLKNFDGATSILAHLYPCATF